MVTEGILTVVFGIVNIILMPLNVVNLVTDGLSFAPITQFISMALYLIPFNELMPIFVFFVSVMLFRIAVAIIKTIWDLLPVL